MKEFTKDDLKNGMVVEYRNGYKRIYAEEVLYDIELEKTISISCFDNHLRNEKGITAFDIIKVYEDFRGFKRDGLIWERNEIDWSKVSVDTPLLIRFISGGEEFKRHFAKYKDGNIYVWTAGYTSFTGTDAVRVAEARLADKI